MTFQLLNMALAIDTIDEHSLSNKAHHEHLSKETKVIVSVIYSPVIVILSIRNKAEHSSYKVSGHTHTEAFKIDWVPVSQ